MNRGDTQVRTSHLKAVYSITLTGVIILNSWPFFRYWMCTSKWPGPWVSLSRFSSAQPPLGNKKNNSKCKVIWSIIMMVSEWDNSAYFWYCRIFSLIFFFSLTRHSITDTKKEKKEILESKGTKSADIIPYYLREKEQLIGRASTESVCVAATSKPIGAKEIIAAVGTLGDSPFRIHSRWDKYLSPTTVTIVTDIV